MAAAKQDIAAAKATLKANEAELELVKRDLANAKLYAPTNGVIQDRLLEPGDMASPQKPVFTLALDDPLWVRAYVAETDLGKIRQGMKAEVTTDSFPDKRYEGWIGFISPTAEFTPKTVETAEVRTKLVYQVRVFVHNPQGELRLGMPAVVTIPLNQPPKVKTSAWTPPEKPSRRSARPRSCWSCAACASGSSAGGRTVQALRNVSLAVRRGRVTGLIGPDGAGKTTLMRLAVGLLVPDEGQITVLGFDATRDSLAVQARVGYMPQRFGLYEDLSVQENLDLYADLQGVPRADRGGTLRRIDAHDRPGPVHRAPGGPVVGRHETKARTGLHAGAPAGIVVARRADRRGRSGLAARTLADRLSTRATGRHDRPAQHRLPRRSGTLRRSDPDARRRSAGARSAARIPRTFARADLHW